MITQEENIKTIFYDVLTLKIYPKSVSLLIYNSSSILLGLTISCSRKTKCFDCSVPLGHSREKCPASPHLKQFLSPPPPPPLPAKVRHTKQGKMSTLHSRSIDYIQRLHSKIIHTAQG